MGKKFTVEEFKITFNKPSMPKGMKAKEKDDLETSVKKDNRQDFEDGARDMYQNYPDYYLKLLGYKLAKHWDAKERAMWLNGSPESALTQVLDDLYGPTPSDKQIDEALEEHGGDTKILAYLYKIAPDKMQAAAAAKIRELKGKEREDFGRSLPYDLKVCLLKDGFQSQDPALVEACCGVYPFLPKNEQKDLADEDPAFFIDNLVIPFKKNDNAVDLFKDPDMRDILAKDNEAWKKLVESTPVLSLSEAAKTRTRKDNPTKEEMTEALFQSLVENDGIDLTYFTCQLDQDRAVLTGMSENDAKNRTEKAQELGVQVPDKPATQCHNLKGVFKHALQANLGNKVKIEEGQVATMLLTVPLTGVPGGLLPNTFGGNVRDDDGVLTKQVMFTGVGGLQSHTWLIIDDVPYDPVLGTKGNQVAASMADEFSWVVPEIVAKGKKGDFIVKDPSVKPAANQHGFGSCYRLTRDVKQYVKGVLGVSFKSDVDGVKVDQVVQGGPADGVLAPLDLILKVDGAPSDATDLDDYGLADERVTRKFEFRRGGKKKKASITAVSALSLG